MPEYTTICYYVLQCAREYIVIVLSDTIICYHTDQQAHREAPRFSFYRLTIIAMMTTIGIMIMMIIVISMMIIIVQGTHQPQEVYLVQ